MGHFKGLPRDFLAFFRELAENNERPWFEANKERFRESVQAPMSAFIAAMVPRLAKISRHFLADPRPNGGSMFRIYRDVRFSRDKRPYKLHAACHFRHAAGKDAHAPGFYMHFTGRGVLWRWDLDATARCAGARARRHCRQYCRLGGSNSRLGVFDNVRRRGRLSRPPRGYDADHPFIEDIKKKSFFAMHRSSVMTARSAALPDEVAATFRAASPLMKFLCKAQGVPF